MTEEINVIYYDDNGNVLHLNQLDRHINDHSNINVYNNTEVDDRQYIGISIIFNLLVCGLFISFVKSVYDKIMICQYNNNRRVNVRIIFFVLGLSFIICILLVVLPHQFQNTIFSNHPTGNSYRTLYGNRKCYHGHWSKNEWITSNYLSKKKLV